MSFFLLFACSMLVNNPSERKDTAGDTGDTGAIDGDTDTEDTESDADTDADTDADADTDTDTDTDTNSGAETPSPGDLVISEIMKNPDLVDDDFGEWFEVTNQTGAALRLDGLEVLDNDDDGFVVDTLTLPARGRVVFGASTDTALNGGAPVDFGYDAEVFKLGNDDGRITLRLAGVDLDVVSYDGTFPDEKGRSLTLATLDAAENDAAAAWCSATSPYGDGDLGTPGAENDTCDGGDDTGIDTGGDEDIDTDGDGTLDVDDCEPTNAAAYPGATERENRIDDDCDGNVDERAPTAGDLLVTEIMKNPDPTSDDYGEWFEVTNVSGDLLELDGLTVTDAGGTGITLSTPDVLTPATPYVLAVSADTSLNGGFTPDYTYAVADLRLANSDDEVVLSLGGAVIDEVAYDSTFPDDSGKTLSLDPRGYTATLNDDADQWCNGDGTYGTDGNQGTPGGINDLCD